MPTESEPTPKSTPNHARLQNDYGADYWVRSAQETRVCTFHAHWAFYMSTLDLTSRQLNTNDFSAQRRDGVSLLDCRMWSIIMLIMGGRGGSLGTGRRAFWEGYGAGAIFLFFVWYESIGRGVCYWRFVLGLLGFESHRWDVVYGCNWS